MIYNNVRTKGIHNCQVIDYIGVVDCRASWQSKVRLQGAIVCANKVGVQAITPLIIYIILVSVFIKLLFFLSFSIT